MEIFAWIDTQQLDDDDTVEVYFNQVGTGLMLHDDGTSGDSQAGDNFYSLIIPAIAPGVPAGQYLFQLVATDYAGNESLAWPYYYILSGIPSPAGPPNFLQDMYEFVHRPGQNQAYIRARTATNRPVIFMAGYMGSYVSATSGGTWLTDAYIPDPNREITAVEILYGGVPTGLELHDDGLHGDFAVGDSIFGSSIPLPGPLPVIPDILFELQATNIHGERSDKWPYLTCHACTPTPTATPTITPTPTPRACFEFVNMQYDPPAVKRGDWVYVDATCSEDTLGQGLEYLFDWGDGNDTGWQTAPYAQHRYFDIGNYQVCLSIRDTSGFSPPVYCKYILVF